MAKIGTAHIELKPVLNDEALEQITAAITAAVKEGVEAGIKAARPTAVKYGDLVIQPGFRAGGYKPGVAALDSGLRALSRERRNAEPDPRIVLEEHPTYWVVASDAVEGAFAYPAADHPSPVWATIVDKDA